MTAAILPAAGPARTISFQGTFGAYSDLACRSVFPDMTTLPCSQFEDAFAVVREGRADLAMIPIENSVAGRVADIHHLLPQCRRLIRELGIEPVVAADTAGAAAEIAARGDPTLAAIASELAGKIYGLVSLKANIEDAEHNTTRFLIMAREPLRPARGTPAVTTFLFRVRNVPAALYKALGGFATNGVNMTKLESYMLGGAFTATQFYADVEAHPDDPPLARALEELAFFSRELKILGVYPAHPARLGQHAE